MKVVKNPMKSPNVGKKPKGRPFENVIRGRKTAEAIANSTQHTLNQSGGILTVDTFKMKFAKLHKLDQ